MKNKRNETILPFREFPLILGGLILIAIVLIGCNGRTNTQNNIDNQDPTPIPTEEVVNVATIEATQIVIVEDVGQEATEITPTATTIPPCIQLYGEIVFSSLYGPLDPYALDPNGVLSIWRKANDAQNITNLVYIDSDLFTPDNTTDFKLGSAPDPTELFDLDYDSENEKYFSNITLEETADIVLYSIQNGCTSEDGFLIEDILAIIIAQSPYDTTDFLHVEVLGPYVAPSATQVPPTNTPDDKDGGGCEGCPDGGTEPET